MTIEKNNLEISDYLNKEFFENVLTNGLKCRNVEIKSLNFTMGSGAGDNYCSFIYRVEVIYTQDEESSPQQVSLIVKSIPYDGPRAIFKEMEIFEKEKVMYLEILPQIEDRLNDVKIAPKCFYAVSKPTNTIVFEDLKASGYELANRVTGLDEEHCKIVLQKLAQYHAASMLLLEKEPSLKDLKELRNAFFASLNMKNEMFEKPCRNNFKALIKNCSSWSGYEDITRKLRTMNFEEFLRRTFETYEVAENDIEVITHGDMWVNNFMFQCKENSDIPINTILIDFQGSCYGSLGLDLNYFFGTSPRLDVLINRTDSLIENSYYATLKKVLESGGYKNIPTLQDIYNEIKKKAFYGFFSTVLMLPFISVNKEDSATNTIENFEDAEIAEKASIIACSSERYVATMKYLLKKFDNYGIFN